MSHVLILGGDGYLGWPTAMHFSARGYEVTVVDNVEVIIRSGGWIDLGNGEDNEGNQVFNGWNNLEVSAENAGFYRIYINLEFEDTGEIVEGSWEFEVV